MRYSIKRQFLLSVETSPGLLWFFRKLAPASQQIKCKTKSNCGLVTHVFARFPDFEILLVMNNSNPASKVTGNGWLSFTSLCDWSRKLTSRPIRYKKKPIRDVSLLFSRLEKVCFESSVSHSFCVFCC